MQKAAVAGARVAGAAAVAGTGVGTAIAAGVGGAAAISGGGDKAAAKAGKGDRRKEAALKKAEVQALTTIITTLDARSFGCERSILLAKHQDRCLSACGYEPQASNACLNGRGRIGGLWGSYV